MEFSLEQIAQLLNGHVEGDSSVKVSRLCKIEEGVAGGISFLANPQYTPYIYETQASAVIVNDSFVAEHPIKAQLIRVEDAYQAFAKLLAAHHQVRQQKVGISPQASIHPSVRLGKDVYVGAFAVIEEGVELGDNSKVYPHVYVGDNSSIGENSTLYSGVKLYPDTQIGKSVVIHAGSIIGGDGFGFAPSASEYNKVPQIGNVVIEDNVEIGANTCIDRATLGSTIIRHGVKLDNLIQIAHNVVIGENTVIASQCGISGSTKVGKNCMFGGQVGIAGHASIADDVKLAAQSGVPSSLKKEGGVYFGSPAIDAGEYRRSFIHFKNLDKIVKQLHELEKKINEKE